MILFNMHIPRFLSHLLGPFSPIRKNIYHENCAPKRPLPWIASPIDETSGSPRLYRRSDATPIELFFDLFFVANLSTFTATHEITNVNGMCLPDPSLNWVELILSSNLSSWCIYRFPRGYLVYLAASKHV